MRAGIILTSGFWLLMITLRNLEKFYEGAYGCSYVLLRINLEIPRKRARLDTTAVAYFKQLAAELGMPYQNLINLFLRDCALHKRRPTIQWPEGASKHRQ